MGIQTTVAFFQGFGVPGERYDDSPFRAQSYIINSALASYNIIGATAFTYVSDGVAAAGGTAKFVGILANPKTQALFGTSGDPLAPTLVLPNNVQASLVTMGSLIVTLPAAANVGDLVMFDNTTGALSTIAASTNVAPSGKSKAYAFVDRYTLSTGGLAVISLTPTTPYLF